MKTVVFDNQEYQLSDEGNTRDLAGQILGDDYRKVLGERAGYAIVFGLNHLSGFL